MRAREPRLLVFQKPRRRRFKVYAVRGLRRVAIADQPYHGFATVAEAFRFALGRSASDAFGAMRGSPVPADELPIPVSCAAEDLK